MTTSANSAHCAHMAHKHDPLDPAATIIAYLGKDVVQSATGLSRTRVYRISQPKENNGADGLFSIEQARKLLDYARSNDVDLVEADFFDAGRLREIMAAKVAAE